MPQTTNYGLHLTNDSSTLFKDWREQIDGTNNSNMILIDNVLGTKADASTTITTSLKSSGWSTSSPYTQSISVPSLSATQNGIASLSPTATAAERDAAREAVLYVSAQSNGSITIVADGTKPLIEIPIQIIVIG